MCVQVCVVWLCVLCGCVCCVCGVCRLHNVAACPEKESGFWLRSCVNSRHSFARSEVAVSPSFFFVLFFLACSFTQSLTVILLA